MDYAKTLTEKIGKQVVQNKDLSVYLTLRTKTHAAYYLEAETRDEIINAYKAAKELEMPFMMLGGGSNLAILHDMIQGLVVRNMYQKKEVIDKTDDYTDILFSSGYPMSRVVNETTRDGLEGFEYHLGLPGTIGGAIYMNSKWTKPVSYCGDTLRYAWLLDKEGNVNKVDREYFQFAYDYSILQKTKELFLEGVFRLTHNDPEVLKQRAQESLAYRKETQPFGVATGGCFFQNISQEEKEINNLPTTSAGYLIDHAGLKGKRIGGYVVSDKHANFVINEGTGTPEDLKKLLDTIKSTVKEKFRVTLMEEVVIV